MVIESATLIYPDVIQIAGKGARGARVDFTVHFNRDNTIRYANNHRQHECYLPPHQIPREISTAAIDEFMKGTP